MKSFQIPISINNILHRIAHAGHEAYLVGGCVRDGLMGLSPHDWDVCTDARPDQIQALFPDSLDYGIRHGTVTVRWNGAVAEVTTYRAESTYTDHRRPDQVTFIQDLNEDLARRDFTVNAIAMDAAGSIRDPFGGVNDLQRGILRSVGVPEARFQEDALRMLRAVRFSAQLGFEIEAQTMQAICACAPLASNLAAERVCTELEKTLLTGRPEQTALLCETGLLLPWGIRGLGEGVQQLSAVPPERNLRWMAFARCLEDANVLKRLRLDTKTISACEAICAIEKNERRDARFWKEAACRYGRTLSKACAEVLSRMENTKDLVIVEEFETSGDCCLLQELAVSGADALALGLRGREIRAALETALRHVWEHPEDNTKERLIVLMREEAKLHG